MQKLIVGLVLFFTAGCASTAPPQPIEQPVDVEWDDLRWNNPGFTVPILPRYFFYSA